MKTLKVTLVVFALLFITGCTFNVSRAGDGALLVEAGIPESVLQKVIQIAIEQDIQLKSLEIDLKPGYIDVAGAREREAGGAQDQVEFNLVLGANAGLPTAQVMGAILNDELVSPEMMISEWNTRISEGIAKVAEETPNAQVENILVDEDNATLILRVYRQ